MAGIKRFITYIYAYENGTKGINAGFAKVEIRGNECRIEVHLRGTPIRMGMDQVYLFKVEGGQMLAFPMGEMRMIKGSGDYGTIIKADQIGGSEYSFAEMDGMVFAGEEGAIAMTRWTEGKPFAVKTENIRLWEPQRFDVGGTENQKENEKNENIAERATAERVNAEQDLTQTKKRQRSFMQRKCQCAIFFRSLSGWTRGSGSKTRIPILHCRRIKMWSVCALN